MGKSFRTDCIEKRTFLMMIFKICFSEKGESSKILGLLFSIILTTFPNIIAFLLAEAMKFHQ